MDPRLLLMETLREVVQSGRSQHHGTLGHMREDRGAVRKSKLTLEQVYSGGVSMSSCALVASQLPILLREAVLGEAVAARKLSVTVTGVGKRRLIGLRATLLPVANVHSQGIRSIVFGAFARQHMQGTLDLVKEME